MMIDKEKQQIETTIQHYFLGTYRGDEVKLRQAFHPDAHITGIFNGTYCDWTLDEFIHHVCSSPSAAVKNEVYQKNIIFIDIQPDAAIVKARVKVADLLFTDYINLLKVDQRWIIRHKSFAV